MKDEPGNASAEGAHDLPARVSPAKLSAPGRDEATAEEHLRTLTGHGDRAVPLHDFVVRATRRR